MNPSMSGLQDLRQGFHNPPRVTFLQPMMNRQCEDFFGCFLGYGEVLRLVTQISKAGLGRQGSRIVDATVYSFF